MWPMNILIFPINNRFFWQEQQNQCVNIIDISMAFLLVVRSFLENENQKKRKKKRFKQFFFGLQEMHQSNGNSRVQGDLLRKKQYAIFPPLSPLQLSPLNQLSSKSFFPNLHSYCEIIPLKMFFPNHLVFPKSFRHDLASMLALQNRA